MRLLEKRTEIENEIMKMYNTEKAEQNEGTHFCTFGIPHRSAFKNSAKFRLTFPIFHFYSQIFTDFLKEAIQTSQILMKILRNFTNFYGKLYPKIIKSGRQILKFPVISQRNLSIFSENCLRKVRRSQKKLEKSQSQNKIRSNSELEKTQV